MILRLLKLAVLLSNLAGYVSITFIKSPLNLQENELVANIYFLDTAVISKSSMQMPANFDK